jgi:hypothetical protein
VAVSSVPRTAVLLLAAALVGCGETERTFAGLDGPGDVALLEPGEFFEVPVAFVSNFRSGRVSKLDLKRTRLLVEDGPAPWLPGPDLSFGADRALSEIALAQRPGELDVWVSDDMHDQILRAPYARTSEGALPWSASPRSSTRRARPRPAPCRRSPISGSGPAAPRPRRGP